MPRAGRFPTTADAALGNKDVQLRVRLTQTEAAQLHAAAQHLGHANVSRFVRWALLQATEQVLAGPGVAQAQQQAHAVAQRVMAPLQPVPAPQPVPQQPHALAQSLTALLGVPLYGGNGISPAQPLTAVDGDDWV